MDKQSAEHLLRQIAASGGTAGEVAFAVELDGPSELVGFHQALMDVARRHAELRVVGVATKAATLVNILWSTWSGREHAGPEVRAAANAAFAAVLQAVRPVPRVVADQWFDVAHGWTDDVRMLAEKKY